ncbi:MAG: dihydrofolate reductase [Bacilli bacterium]|nr:dihydrofolate reductase [Bacilli bacterium]
MESKKISITMKNLSLIAAIGKNRELGYHNDLIWRIKEDLNFFKHTTMGSYIIMGKNTYNSLPKSLPGRQYMVLTSDPTITATDKLQAFRNLKDILEIVNVHPSDSFYVVGGGQVYNSLLPYVNSMHLTEIQDSYEKADTFFPTFDKEEWTQKASPILQENDIEYKHILYLRKEQ